MAVSPEEMERRRRLAEQTAQEVDPSEIVGLAPPPTSPQPRRRIETQQAPDRVNARPTQTTQFGPAGATTQFNLSAPPQQDRSAEAAEIFEAARRKNSPERRAQVREIFDTARKDVANRTAGRFETAASEAGEAFTSTLADIPRAAVMGVLAEKQGQGLASKVGVQPLATLLLGRELTDKELTHLLPAIENNAVSKAIESGLDFNLGSNPAFLSNPDEDFDVANFFTSSVPAAVGSMGVFVTAGLIVTAAGGGPFVGGATAATLGAMVGGMETARGVKALGGNNEQIIDAFVAGNLPGLTEGFPIGRALNRLDRGSGGQISRMIKEGFKGSVEEMIQEGAQGASQKAIENAILDLDQDLFDRTTKEGAAAGGVAGFITSFLLTAVGGRRRGPAARAEAEADGDTPPPATPPPAQPEPEGAPTTPAPEGPAGADQGDVNLDTLLGTEVEPDAAPTPEPTPEPAPEAVPATSPDAQADIDALGGPAAVDDLTELVAGLSVGIPEERENFAANVEFEALARVHGIALAPGTPVERLEQLQQALIAQLTASSPTGPPDTQAAPEGTPETAIVPEPEAAPGTPPAALPAPEPVAIPEGVPEPELTTAELPEIAQPVAPTGTQEGRHTVQTAAGLRVETQFATANVDDLITSDNEAFTTALQPRERGKRQPLDQQIAKIIKEFDPRQIAGPDPTAAAGSPIVNNRGEVISGNGRIAVLRRIFEQEPELAEQYQTFVRDELGVDLQPGQVLVQAVTQPMTAEQQRGFVDQANIGAQADFSPAEQARIDARGIDEAMISQLQTAEITSLANDGFVRSFVSAMQARGESVTGLVQAGGELSTDGRKRIENAILARALGAGDAQVAALERTIENPDNNTKNVTAAILDAAPQLVSLQLAAENGTVDQAAAGQIAPALAQAVDLLSQTRRTEGSVEELLGQQDIEGPRPALVDEFIRAFMSPNLGRAASRQNMAQIFQLFATNLQRQADTQQGDLLGAAGPTDPAAVLKAAREAIHGELVAPDQAGLFGGQVGGTVTQLPQPEGAVQGAPSPATAPGVTNVKRADNFETEGAYNVTLPSGRQVQIFRDTEQFGNPVWHVVDDANALQIPDNSILRTTGIGATQREAIGTLEQIDAALGALSNEQQPAVAVAGQPAGVVTPQHPAGQTTTTGANQRNSGTTAPSTGTPVSVERPEGAIEADNPGAEGLVSGQPQADKPEQAEPEGEKQAAPGTIHQGDQNKVANQKKQSYEQKNSPQYDEKAAILGNDLLDQLEKGSKLNESLPELHPNISTLAISINKELIKSRTVQFIGKVIETAKDFATLAQVWRDPQFETLRIIFMDQNHKVIFQTGVSQRLPDSVDAAPEGEVQAAWVDNLFKRMQAAGAARVFMQHNHPSGSAEPSSADKKHTRWTAKYAVKYGMQLRHIVINSNEYTVLAANGSSQTFREEFHEGDDPLLTPPEGMSHDLLGEFLPGNQDVAKAGKAIQTADQVTLIGLDSKRRVRAIGEMSWSKFKNLKPKQLQEEIENWRLNAGSRRVVIAGLPIDTVIFPDAPIARGNRKVSAAAMKTISPLGNKLHSALTRTGVVEDFIDTNGESAMYHRMFQKGGAKQGKGRNDTSATKIFEDETRLVLNEIEIDSEAVRRQRETVGNVRSGQPLDRLFRWMFTGLGVFEDRWLQTNAAGEDPTFRLGGAAFNKLTHFLSDTWFPTDTNAAATQEDSEGRAPYAPGRIRSAAFAYGNRILKRARNGLIDRFNLPDGVRQLDETRFQERLETVTEGVTSAKKLIDMGVDSLEEATLLNRFLTGEASEEEVSDKEWAAVAVEVRASLDQLGMEAVTLGFVSRESYERNKGTWMKRSYYSKEPFLSDGDGLNKWIGETLRGPGRGIKGDEFKGRGLFLEHEQERLLRDVPRDLRDRLGFGQPKTKTTGKADPSLLNSRWKIFDVLFDQSASMVAPGIPAAAEKTKVKRRVFWPADEPVPNTFGNYEYRGDFVVRNVKGRKFTLWRDFTRAERDQMGEIMDARYNIIKSFQLLSRDLANGRFFKAIAENDEWTWNPKVHGEIPPELVAKQGDKLRHFIDYEWVQVPKTPVEGTVGHVNKWGELAGKFIRTEVWKDISEISEMNQSSFWNRLLTEWKLNKTARNPVVHMNNVMSNMVLMDLLDIRTRDLVEGTMMRLAPIILNNPKLKKHHAFFKKFENAPLLNEMRASGAFGHSLVDVELTGEVLDPIARELRDIMGQVKNEKSGSSMRLTARFLKAAAGLWAGQTSLYRLEDEFFRTATVIRKLQQGYDMSTSAKMGREQFLNYDIRAPWINAARRTVMPFISYTYRAVPALTEAIMRRPWKLAKYIMIAEAANAMAYAISGGDEEFERGSLRDQVQGDISFGLFPGGVPRMLRLPMNDEHGRPQFLDIRRWIPAGDVFDLHNASPMPVPTWMYFAGPLMIAGELVLNRSAFTGQDIVDPAADDLGDKALKWGGFLFQSYAPSAPYIPESWYWNRIAEAGKRTDPVGRTNSRTQAILQSIGIKASSQDPELGYVYRAREFESTARSIKGQLNKAARDFSRNIINESGWKDAQAQYLRRMGNLTKLMEETFAPYVEHKGAQPPTEFEDIGSQ